jgi:hypothetical protein
MTNMKNLIAACLLGLVAGGANAWAADSCCDDQTAAKTTTTSSLTPASCCSDKAGAGKASCSMAATAGKQDCSAKLAKSGKRHLKTNQKGATLLAQL